MTTLETTTYSYARTGQLNSVQLPDGTLIEYLHNAAGQRVAKKVNGVITEKYLWAGLTRLLAVYDGSDNLLIRFEGAKMVKNGQAYYLVGDQVGSIRAVVDAAGNIVKEITYDSFGNILTDTNPTFTIPIGFAGGLHDPDTGLVRFGFRDYDPDTGRWTARDPIGLAGGLYPYLYCNQNPICCSDPLGLKWGWNVLGSAISEGFASLADSALSIATFGHYGIDPLAQGYMYGGSGMVKAQKILIGISTGATVGGLGLLAFAPGLAFAELTLGTATVAAVTSSEGAAKLTYDYLPRANPGRDGGRSVQIIERLNGVAISRIHQVTNAAGQIIHQHQDHIGKYGTIRSFPDAWVQYPSIGN